jgi:arsenical pump membrane protein
VRRLRTPGLPGWGFLLLGVVLVLTGALPRAAAESIGERTWPILLFLVVAAVSAELLDQIGLFDVVTHRAARLARGRTVVLFALHVAVCTACTVLLSLDTTAVMLTPLAVTVARELAVDVLPFAFATLWLANTASLLLPVSNLTNLLAHERLDLSAVQFAALMWKPQAVALVATVLVVVLLHGRRLRGRFDLPSEPAPHDGRAVALAGVATAVFTVLVLVGTEPWLAALAMLVLLVPARAMSGPGVLGELPRMVPWATTALALGLFLVIGTVVRQDPGGLLSGLSDRSAGHPVLLAAAGGAAANLVNNLPAYLALEPAATTPVLSAALLTGTNAAAVVLPWGSLATLLWLQACRRRGVDVPLRQVVGGGALLALLVVGGSAFVLGGVG